MLIPNFRHHIFKLIAAAGVAHRRSATERCAVQSMLGCGIECWGPQIWKNRRFKQKTDKNGPVSLIGEMGALKFYFCVRGGKSWGITVGMQGRSWDLTIGKAEGRPGAMINK